MRRLLLVVVAGACLTLPAAARPEAPSTTATGTMLGVTEHLQVVTLATGEKCGVYGGTLRTETGDVHFGGGGLLTPADTLDPSAQALYDTVLQASHQGSAVAATITYEESTLCGYPGNVITGASLRAVPTPAPTPPPGLTPTPTPEPIPRTVSGYVARITPLGELIVGASFCKLWPGILKTDAGSSLLFSVVSPLAGSLDTGLTTTDPAAVERAEMLQRAAFFGRRAPVTMTYIGPVRPCNYPLDAVVTAATVRFPSPYDTKPKVTRRGRITRISQPSVYSGYGATCRIWRGTLKDSGARFSFAVETRLTGSPPRASDPRAVKNARALRRARKNGVRTRVTMAGPVIACGKQLTHAVTTVSTR